MSRAVQTHRRDFRITFFLAKYSLTLRWQEKKQSNMELFGRGNRLKRERPSELNPLSGDKSEKCLWSLLSLIKKLDPKH